MDESPQPSHGASAMRLLAAALAGAIGAFGMPAGVHAAQPPAAAVATPLAVPSDVKPE